MINMKRSCKCITFDEGIEVSILGMTGKWKRLITPADTDNKEVMGIGFLEKGDSRGWHTHPKGEEEILYVIKGKALLEWKENGEIKKLIAEEGTAIYTPDEIENNISNIYSETMYCVFFIRLH